MSSDMKDARWGLAHYIADSSLSLDFEDFTYAGWQKLLDEAQRRLDKYPDEIDRWAARFRGEDD